MATPETDKVFTGSIPKLYDTYLVPLIFDIAYPPSAFCPRCGNRLKYLARGEHEDRVQCVRRERVWLRAKRRWLGHTLRAAENSGSEVKRR